MKLYKMTGGRLEPLYVLAKDMDEAFAKARQLNPNYNGGQLVCKQF